MASNTQNNILRLTMFFVLFLVVTTCAFISADAFQVSTLTAAATTATTTINPNFQAATFSLNQYDSLSVFYNQTFTFSSLPTDVNQQQQSPDANVLQLPPFRLNVSTTKFAMTSLLGLEACSVYVQSPISNTEQLLNWQETILLNDNINYRLDVSLSDNNTDDDQTSSSLLQKKVQNNRVYVTFNDTSSNSNTDDNNGNGNNNIMQFNFKIVKLTNNIINGNNNDNDNNIIVNPRISCPHIFFSTPSPSTTLIYTSIGTTNITRKTLIYRTTPLLNINNNPNIEMNASTFFTSTPSPTGSTPPKSGDGSALSYDLLVSLSSSSLITTLNNYNIQTIATYNILKPQDNPLPNLDIDEDLQFFVTMLTLTTAAKTNHIEQSKVTTKLQALRGAAPERRYNPYISNPYDLRIRTTPVSSPYEFELSLPFLSYKMKELIHYNPIPCIATATTTTTTSPSTNQNQQNINNNNPLYPNKVIGYLYYDYNKELLFPSQNDNNNNDDNNFDIENYLNINNTLLTSTNDIIMTNKISRFYLQLTTESITSTTQCNLHITIPHSEIEIESMLWTRSIDYQQQQDNNDNTNIIKQYTYNPHQIWAINGIDIVYFPQPTLPPANRFGSMLTQALAKLPPSVGHTTTNPNQQNNIITITNYYETYKNIILQFKVLTTNQQPLKICVSDNLSQHFIQNTTINQQYLNTGLYNPWSVNALANIEMNNKFSINPVFFQLQCGGYGHDTNNHGYVHNLGQPTIQTNSVTCWDLNDLYYNQTDNENKFFEKLINTNLNINNNNNDLQQQQHLPLQTASKLKEQPQSINNTVWYINDGEIGNNYVPSLQQTAYLQGPAVSQTNFNFNGYLLYSHCQLIYNKFNSDTCEVIPPPIDNDTNNMIIQEEAKEENNDNKPILQQQQDEQQTTLTATTKTNTKSVIPQFRFFFSNVTSAVLEPLGDTSKADMLYKKIQKFSMPFKKTTALFTKTPNEEVSLQKRYISLLVTSDTYITCPIPPTSSLQSNIIQSSSSSLSNDILNNNSPYDIIIQNPDDNYSIKNINRHTDFIQRYNFSLQQPLIPLEFNTIITEYQASSSDDDDDDTPTILKSYVPENKLSMIIGQPEPVQPFRPPPSDGSSQQEAKLDKRRVFKNVNILVMLPFIKQNTHTSTYANKNIIKNQQQEQQQVDNTENVLLQHFKTLYNITTTDNNNNPEELNNIIKENINLQHIIPNYYLSHFQRDVQYEFLQTATTQCTFVRLLYTSMGTIDTTETELPKAIIEPYVHPFIYSSPKYNNIFTQQQQQTVVDGDDDENTNNNNDDMLIMTTTPSYGFIPYFVVTLDEVDTIQSYRLECTYGFYSSVALLNDGLCVVDFGNTEQQQQNKQNKIQQQNNDDDNLTDNHMLWRTSDNFIPVIGYATHNNLIELKLNNLLDLIKYKLTLPLPQQQPFTTLQTRLTALQYNINNYYKYHDEIEINNNTYNGYNILLPLKNTQNYADYYSSSNLPIYSPIQQQQQSEEGGGNNNDDQIKIQLTQEYFNLNNLAFTTVSRPCWPSSTDASSSSSNNNNNNNGNINQNNYLQRHTINIETIAKSSYLTYSLTISGGLQIYTTQQLTMLNKLFINALYLDNNDDDNNNNTSSSSSFDKSKITLNDIKIIDYYHDYTYDNHPEYIHNPTSLNNNNVLGTNDVFNNLNLNQQQQQSSSSSQDEQQNIILPVSSSSFSLQFNPQSTVNYNTFFASNGHLLKKRTSVDLSQSDNTNNNNNEDYDGDNNNLINDDWNDELRQQFDHIKVNTLFQNSIEQTFENYLFSTRVGLKQQIKNVHQSLSSSSPSSTTTVTAFNNIQQQDDVNNDEDQQQQQQQQENDDEGNNDDMTWYNLQHLKATDQTLFWTKPFYPTTTFESKDNNLTPKFTTFIFVITIPEPSNPTPTDDNDQETEQEQQQLQQQQENDLENIKKYKLLNLFQQDQGSFSTNPLLNKTNVFDLKPINNILDIDGFIQQLYQYKLLTRYNLNNNAQQMLSIEKQQVNNNNNNNKTKLSLQPIFISLKPYLQYFSSTSLYGKKIINDASHNMTNINDNTKKLLLSLHQYNRSYLNSRCILEQYQQPGLNSINNEYKFNKQFYTRYISQLTLASSSTDDNNDNNGNEKCLSPITLTTSPFLLPIAIKRIATPIYLPSSTTSSLSFDLNYDKIFLYQQSLAQLMVYPQHITTNTTRGGTSGSTGIINLNTYRTYLYIDEPFIITWNYTVYLQHPHYNNIQITMHPTSSTISSASNSNGYTDELVLIQFISGQRPTLNTNNNNNNNQLGNNGAVQDGIIVNLGTYPATQGYTALVLSSQQLQSILATLTEDSNVVSGSGSSSSDSSSIPSNNPSFYGYFQITLLSNKTITTTSYQPSLNKQSTITHSIIVFTQCTRQEVSTCAGYGNSYCNIQYHTDNVNNFATSAVIPNANSDDDNTTVSPFFTTTATATTTTAVVTRHPICSCKEDYVIGSKRGSYHCYKYDIYCSLERNEKIRHDKRITKIDLTKQGKFKQKHITKCTSCHNVLLNTCNLNNTSWSITSRQNNDFNYDAIPYEIKQYYKMLYLLTAPSTTSLTYSLNNDNNSNINTETNLAINNTLLEEFVKEKYLNKHNILIGNVNDKSGRGYNSYCGDCICLPGYGGKYCNQRVILGLIALSRNGGGSSGDDIDGNSGGNWFSPLSNSGEQNTNKNQDNKLFDFLYEKLDIQKPQQQQDNNTNINKNGLLSLYDIHNKNVLENMNLDLETELYNILQQKDPNDDDEDDGMDEGDIIIDDDLFSTTYPIEFSKQKAIKDIRLSSTNGCHLLRSQQRKIIQYLSFVLQIPQAHLYIINYDCNAIVISINIGDNTHFDDETDEQKQQNQIITTAVTTTTSTMKKRNNQFYYPIDYIYNKWIQVSMYSATTTSNSVEIKAITQGNGPSLNTLTNAGLSPTAYMYHHDCINNLLVNYKFQQNDSDDMIITLDDIDKIKLSISHECLLISSPLKETRPPNKTKPEDLMIILIVVFCVAVVIAFGIFALYQHMRRHRSAERYQPTDTFTATRSGHHNNNADSGRKSMAASPYNNTAGRRSTIANNNSSGSRRLKDKQRSAQQAGPAIEMKPFY